MPVMTETPQSSDVKLVGFANGRTSIHRGSLAVETALEVVVNGRSHSVLMQTPGAETELVTGYLYTEGLIDSPKDLDGLEFLPGPSFLGIEGLQVRAHIPGLEGQALPDRPALSLSSCGLCGKEALDKLGRGLSRVRSKQVFSWHTLERLLDDLSNHQPLYAETRGVHAVALYAADGTFRVCYEDVGRHNALDKVVGRTLIDGGGFSDKVLVLSGRASLEMALKAARAGVPLLLCFSSPHGSGRGSGQGAEPDPGRPAEK